MQNDFQCHLTTSMQNKLSLKSVINRSPLERRTFLKYLLAIATNVAIPSLSLKAAEKPYSYILATATTGGTYYPVGVAVATLTKVKLAFTQQIELSALNTAGSGENLKLLGENQAQFAFLQELYGRWAWNGEGNMQGNPQNYLRSITRLWPNVEHFVIASDLVRTGTVADLMELNGAKFSLGKHHSGTQGSGRHILSALGITVDKTFDLVYLGYAQAADALENATIKGFNLPGGSPVSAVSRAFETLGGEMTMLEFTNAQLKQVNRLYPLWFSYLIPANTYAGQKKAIRTLAQSNLLVVREDVKEEVVYWVTKTIYENLPFFNSIHPATQDLSPHKAIHNLPIPLHPGARRYYQEMGLTLPPKTSFSKSNKV